jgi:uncharacterized lipoprotein YddW (UPF0748 family)
MVWIYAKRLAYVLAVLFCFAWWSASSAPAQAASPLGVVQSERNAGAYQDQHLGNFEEAWQAFRQTLQSANVRFDLLSDKDVSVGPARLKEYKVVMVPLLVDLPSEAVFSLTEYLKGGGKIIITDGGGSLGQNAQALARLAGVTVTTHSMPNDPRQLVWKRDPLPLVQDFAVGTQYADVQLTDGGNALAQWMTSAGTESGAAIVRRNNGIYISWAPGMQGEISTNASLLSMAMDELVPGITQQAAVQISFADYTTIKQELDYLTKRTEEAINTAKQADLAVPFKMIMQHYEAAMSHAKSFEEAYRNREFYRADEELSKTRTEFSLAFAQSMPVRPVEARSIWLDRGTIVSTHGPAGMSALFDKLKAAGINVVYFETNNAGFCTFPTKVSTPNPETVSWDPLGTAIKEAHKRGMECHAWFWIFAVGNIRHNPIIGRDPDFPGPVLPKDFSWALAGANGSLLPANQPEFWIDPANLQGRQFVKDLILEVVNRYPVDGIQLDYIRYPFNSKGKEMGYDWVGRMRFEQETGMSLDKLDDDTRQVWQAWKAQQVTDFVRDVSTTLKRMKPGFRISAAVYGTPRRLRLSQIQQDWETWVANGWVDTINPMTYVPTASELAIAAGNVREATADNALVYPGLSIRQLDTAGLIEQLDTSRVIGTLGTTMFAAAQLDDKKQEILRMGPYRKQPLLTPQSQPVRASRLLVDDFAAMVNRYLQDPKKHILSDQASTNEVLTQIMQIQSAMHRISDNASATDLECVSKEIVSLHNMIKEWLRLEAFVQRGFRAQYIANYLSQVEAIMSYAAHKAKTEAQMLAGNAHP